MLLDLVWLLSYQHVSGLLLLLKVRFCHHCLECRVYFVWCLLLRSLLPYSIHMLVLLCLILFLFMLFWWLLFSSKHLKALLLLLSYLILIINSTICIFLINSVPPDRRYYWHFLIGVCLLKRAIYMIFSAEWLILFILINYLYFRCCFWIASHHVGLTFV